MVSCRYAATPSTQQAVIERYNWGCSEILSLADNFLQRKIFVLAHPGGSQHEWTCSLYRLSTATRGNKIYATLEVGECTKASHLAKIHDKERPLIFRYWGENYSAYVHTLPPAGQTPDETEEKNLAPAVQSCRSSSAEECSCNWCRLNLHQGPGSSNSLSLPLCPQFLGLFKMLEARTTHTNPISCFFQTRD